jgi:hypothetical protein
MTRSGGTPEYSVYVEVVDALAAASWTVVCASPPSGTDARYPNCHLPRPGGDRGRRDEVDITAVRDGLCLLIECKGTLADSITVRNALGETDVEKLRRLSTTYTAGRLRAMLRQVHGSCPRIDEVQGAVAVGLVNGPIPAGLNLLLAQPTPPLVTVVAGALPASLLGLRADESSNND